MFRRLESSVRPIGLLTFEGQPVSFHAGDSVAAALIAAGIHCFRDSPVDASPRAPYCMMGICFECLVEIDGLQNTQACLVTAQAGMEVRRQRGARDLRECAP